ncbi:MAG TPA: hypothetical protein VMD59_12555 [Acidimicrobiales bacterium]|nr:hypothetical protein [Acidimicrobiales bacterium]
MPNGAAVPRGGNAGFLGPLPVELLGRPELADLLRRLGITTIGAFARLSEEDVLARFGSEDALAHRLARGLDERPLEGRRVPPDLAVQADLDPPAERVDQAAFVARSLATSLCEQLSLGGLACNRLAVEVSLSNGEQLRRVWEHDGSWGPALVAERVRWQLEAWITERGEGADGSRHGSAGDDRGGRSRRSSAHTGSASTGSAHTGSASEDDPDEGVAGSSGVESVRLGPLEVGPDRGRQSSLWGRSHAGEERVLRVAVRIQGMLGPEGVSRPVLVGGRSPADQVRLLPFGDPLPPTLTAPGITPRPRTPPPPWPGCLPVPSPAVVVNDVMNEVAVGEAGSNRAVDVELLDASGRRVLVDGRGALSAAPARLVLGPTSEAIAAWAGPWPVDERWWDGPRRRRRARMQLLTDGGEGYLVGLERSRWQLDGIYD